MTLVSNDLWNLTPGGRQIDPEALVGAIERQVASGDLDFRTRLLIRDGLNALARYWGDARLANRLEHSEHREQVRQIWGEQLGEPGFPSLAWRVMQPTRAESILEFLEELGGRLRTPSRVYIGGSVALILPRLLSRATDHIDVVDELPPSVRQEYALLDDLAKRYGLRLAHFQSHYLPSEWQSRVHSLGRFGELETYLLDSYDVCVSKLFSTRTKDLDDLRHLKHQLDKDTLARRLVDFGGPLRGEARLRTAAELNWRILFSEPLP